MKTSTNNDPIIVSDDNSSTANVGMPDSESNGTDENQVASNESLNEKIEAVEAIKKFTDEEEDDGGEFSLKSILGGDILQSRFILKQVLFIFYLVVLCLIYTANRYSSQQDAIVIDSLRTHLQDVKYNVMTQSSELLNLTRQSNIEKLLRNTKDSLLHNPVTPPYLILKDGYDDKPPLEEDVDDPDLPTGDEV